MRIVLEIAGDRQIDREILRVGEHAGDAAPAFSRIADLLMDETAEQFATEGQHASGGWKPLAASTLRQRGGGRSVRSGLIVRQLEGGIFAGASEGAIVESRGHIKILDDTGALRRSLTERGDGNQILQIGPQEMTFGSRLAYGGFHQRGTRRMPQRRPVELTESARAHVIKILQRWIVTGELES